MFAEQVFVGGVIVADADAGKRLAKHLDRFFFAPANATAKQHIQGAGEDPGVTGFAAHLPAGFVNVHYLLQYDELGNGLFLVAPVFTELIDQTVGL